MRLLTARDSYDRRKSKRTGQFRHLTKEEVLALVPGRVVKLYWYRDEIVTDAKVNGKVKTWKRDTRRIEVPIKYGMYSCATLPFEGGAVSNGLVAIVVQEGGWNEPGQDRSAEQPGSDDPVAGTGTGARQRKGVRVRSDGGQRRTEGEDG